MAGCVLLGIDGMITPLHSLLVTEMPLTPKTTEDSILAVTGVVVESLERFAQNRRIIEQFSLQWLVNVSTDLGRLHHVATLRQVSTGRYYHPTLREAFSEPGIHQALFYCHEELFDKVLEKTLQEQEWDLRTMFFDIGAPAFEIASRWLELEYFRLLVPLGTPAYLRDLFFSNIRVILNLIVSEHAMISTAA